MMALVRQDFSIILLIAIQLPLYTLSLVLFLFGFRVFVWGIFWLIGGGVLFVCLLFLSFFFLFYKSAFSPVIVQGNPPHPALACFSAFTAAGMFLLLCPIWPRGALAMCLLGKLCSLDAVSLIFSFKKLKMYQQREPCPQDSSVPK